MRNSSHKTTLIIIGVALLLIGAIYYLLNEGMLETSDRTEITTVTYQCDEGRSITATYYEGAEMSEPEAGEPPVPTGSVEVALDGGATMVLEQTLSASGVRYASADESFVFWNKGEEALIMRDNSMDLTYTNCTAAE